MNKDKLCQEIDKLTALSLEIENGFTVDPNRINEKTYEDLVYLIHRTKELAIVLSIQKLRDLADLLEKKHAHLDKDPFDPLETDIIYLRAELNATKRILSEGKLENIIEIAREQVFKDYLEAAGHLLNEGWKDASAVMIGGVLEQKLKRLCITHEVPALSNNKPVKLDQLNIELQKKGVYNQLMKKSITTWADLRNNAAHGNYEEYTKEQVVNMYSFVKDFIAEYI